MKYLLCKDVNDEYEKVWVKTENNEIEKGDAIVYPSYEEIPGLCIVEKFIDELDALIGSMSFIEPIACVSMKAYKEKRKKEIQRAKLQAMLKSKIDEATMFEKLKKNSELTPEISDLFNKLKELSE